MVMGWMWLRIATAAQRLQADHGSRPFLSGKLQAARYFYARELSRVPEWAHRLERNDSTAFEMKEDWF